MSTLEQRDRAHRKRRIYIRRVQAGIIPVRIPNRLYTDAEVARIHDEAHRLIAAAPPEPPDEIRFRQTVLHYLHEDLDDRLWGDNTKENA